MSRRRPLITGQFAPRLIEMLNSPAYRVMSLSAHRALSRLEIELANHGGEAAKRGTENGSLIVTYGDFIDYGITREAIASALRELEALGIIEITERGRGGNAAFHTPNKFRITYRHTRHAEPTNEWRRITTADAAEKTAANARKPVATAPRKNKTPIRKSEPGPVRETHTGEA